MKKTGLALFGILIFFASCEEKNYSVVVENLSSKSVSYTYGGSKDALEPGQDKTYSVRAYTQPPKDISVTGTMSILMENGRGEKFTFSNAEYFDLFVFNALPVEITVEADGYIDDGEDSTELTVPANEERAAKIYTSRPSFTTDSGYPVVFDWKFVKATEDTDEDTDTIYLILR